MSKNEFIITPHTKVGILLETYPQLEKLLLEVSPDFAKLKNPILRKTIGRIATLEQAAKIGNVKIGDLVNKLRQAVGQETLSDLADSDSTENIPLWFDEKKIANRFDANPVISGGGSPMAEIQEMVKHLKPGEIMELKTPFVPAPIVDILKKQGQLTYSKKEGEQVLTYILKV